MAYCSQKARGKSTVFFKTFVCGNNFLQLLLSGWPTNKKTDEYCADRASIWPDKTKQSFDCDRISTAREGKTTEKHC